MSSYNDKFENFRNAFILFDKDNCGYICKEDLKNIINSFGIHPTDQEIDTLVII